MALARPLVVLCALGFALVACQPEYRWEIVFKPCKDSCGPDDVKQKRAVCVDGLSRPVNEELCMELEKPFLSADKPNNRVRRQGHGSPSVSPKFVAPHPLVQPSVTDGSMTISAGQNVIIHAGDNNHLTIDAVLVEGEPAQITWTLPDKTSLSAGQSSGRFTVFHNGSLLIEDIEHPDEGTYKVEATNAAGMDMKSSMVTVWDYTWVVIVGSCTHTCGDFGFKPALVLCRNNKQFGASVDEVHCRHRMRAPHPPPTPCNRIPCGVAPKFSSPGVLNQPEPIADEDMTVTLKQNVIIRKGNQLTVNAEVIEGDPDPTISWALADGSTLSAGGSSGRFSVSANGKQLTISNIDFGDEGSYVATATNTLGSATGTTMVTVVEPPQFSSPAPLPQPDLIPNQDWKVELNQNLSIITGNSLVIDAVVVKGRPDPDISWALADGSTLSAGGSSGRFSVSADGKQLTVSNVGLGDAGSYVATATNSAGSTTGTTRVAVVEPPEFRSPAPLVQPDPVPDQNLVIVLNQNASVIAGNRLTINAVVVKGQPDPDIQWTLADGSTLSAGMRSGRFSVSANGKRLIMRNLGFGDVGSYIATATNAAGTAVGTTAVTVIEPPQFSSPAPLVQPVPVPNEDLQIELNQNASVIAGNRLAINAVIVKGRPDPDIQWTLPDGSALSAGGSSGRFSVSGDGKQLTISGADFPDEGTYTATATNRAGTAVGRSTVTVLEPPAFKSPRPFVQPSQIPDTNVRIRLNQDAYVLRGNRLVINAVLTNGQRSVTMLWTLSDGSTLGAGGRSGRFRVTPDGTRLKISDVQLVDTGSYIATASNRAGNATGQCQVTVLKLLAFEPVDPLVQPSPIPDADVSADVNQNVTIVEGNRLVLDAVTTGNTPADKSWTLPDGMTLKPGESSGRFRVFPNGSLEIQNVQLDDAGLLRANASNRAGTATGTTRLTVIREPAFVIPEPLVQDRPIECSDMSVKLGQNVLINHDFNLVITAELADGVSPAPTIEWTLPNGGKLQAGGRSGNVQVSQNGTQLTVTEVEVDNEGSYNATATNSGGAATLGTQVTVAAEDCSAGPSVTEPRQRDPKTQSMGGA